MGGLVGVFFKGGWGEGTGVCSVKPMRQVHALESCVSAVLQEDANVGGAAWRSSRVGVGSGAWLIFSSRLLGGM